MGRSPLLDAGWTGEVDAACCPGSARKWLSPSDARWRRNVRSQVWANPAAHVLEVGCVSPTHTCLGWGLPELAQGCSCCRGGRTDCPSCPFGQPLLSLLQPLHGPASRSPGLCSPVGLLWRQLFPRKGRKATGFSLTEASALGPPWPCQLLRGRSLEVAVCLLAGGAGLSMQPEEGGSDTPLMVTQGSWAAWGQGTEQRKQQSLCGASLGHFHCVLQSVGHNWLGKASPGWWFEKY